MSNLISHITNARNFVANEISANQISASLTTIHWNAAAKHWTVEITLTRSDYPDRYYPNRVRTQRDALYEALEECLNQAASYAASYGTSSGDWLQKQTTTIGTDKPLTLDDLI